LPSTPLLELGGVIIGLAILARLAGRVGISAIPLYLLAGLAFGKGGILPLVTTQGFIAIGAELGLILLLFMLGLEYSARQLTSALRTSARSGLTDVALNYIPGFVAALILGWGPLAAAFLGGVTLVSSSGIVAKLMQDLGRLATPEAPVIVSVLVIEDLAMAVYLPVLVALSATGSVLAGVGWAVLAIAAVAGVIALALRVDVGWSRLLFSRSDEVLLLTLLGFALVVAGAGQKIHVSTAVGALLAGIALSGPAAERAQALLAPLRDLFAAIFFAFIGFGVDPSELPRVLVPALVLALVTAGTKFLSGWLSGRFAGIGSLARIRVGTMLIPRGEFSVAIAGIAAAAHLDERFVPFVVAYVLFLAVGGSAAARFVEPAAERRRVP
jgi:monovalent cation:H+ antiporter-2, CPA2 family